MEDIPPGIVAILTPSGVDVLSHIGIRARTQKVLLASCHDAGIFSALVGANQGHEFAKVALDSTMQVSCPLSLDVCKHGLPPSAPLLPRSLLYANSGGGTGNSRGGRGEFPDGSDQGSRSCQACSARPVTGQGQICDARLGIRYWLPGSFPPPAHLSALAMVLRLSLACYSLRVEMCVLICGGAQEESRPICSCCASPRPRHCWVLTWRCVPLCACVGCCGL